MKERHWTNLISALRHGQCILMLGPELPARACSADPTAAPDESTTLVEALRCELASELEGENQRPCGNTLAAVAQQYEDFKEFGPSNLRTTAEKFYKPGRYGPSSVHEKLASLPFPLIVTTCQDDLLTQALNQKKTPLTQRYNLRGEKGENPEFLIPGSPSSPLVYHLFGIASEPKSLVLSENDILDFLISVVSEDPPIPNSLRSALKRKEQSFLFLGFGIRHWDLRILLKILLRTWERDSSQSTTIAAEPLRGLPQSDCDEMILFYQRGTRVELEDTDIGEFLTEVSRRLEAEGGYAGQIAPLGTRPRVFISYAHEDADLATRLFNALQKEYFDPWLDSKRLEGGEDWDQRIKRDLEASDFTVVLYTAAFCRKTDSYVNKEVALAANRAQNVRGSFLIPLRTCEIADADRVEELRKYNEMELRPEAFEQDISKVISTMRREYQLRNR